MVDMHDQLTEKLVPSLLVYQPFRDIGCSASEITLNERDNLYQVEYGCLQSF